MKIKKVVLPLALCAGILLTFLSACKPKDPSGPDNEPGGISSSAPDGEENTGTPVDDLPPVIQIDKELAEWEEPYRFCYRSNGNETCEITDIIVNYRFENIEVVIPEKAPNGDRVISVAPWNPSAYLNVPKFLLPEDYEAIMKRLAEFGITEDVKEISKFTMYCQMATLFEKKDLTDCKTEKDAEEMKKKDPLTGITAYYVLPAKNDINMRSASQILAQYCGFTEQQCLETYRKFCAKIQSETKDADTASTLIDMLSLPFSAEAIVSVTFPTTMESLKPHTFYGFSALTSIAVPGKQTVIETGALLGCDTLTLIQYGGTMAEWKEQYDKDFPGTVQCSDGNIVSKKNP